MALGNGNSVTVLVPHVPLTRISKASVQEREAIFNTLRNNFIAIS